MIIGLDVGGTHTDVVLLDKNGLVKEIKVPTDTKDLFNTVLTGLEKITENIDQSKVKRAVLSTTLTTNAIIQKNFQEVGIIVSSGPGIDPELFKTNKYYFTVSGSIDHRGREIKPINRSEIEDIIKELKEAGIQHVGVIGKFSARNPKHELEIAKLLEGSFEKVFLGHRVSGNLSFPRRITTTYLNTAIYHIHKEFFIAVKKSLEKKGLVIPIHVLKADGGTMNFQSSINFPGQTILSGPAASVMGAISSAPEAKDVIVLDIGGTTTDIAVLINKVPVLEPMGINLSGYKTLIRSLKTHSIGLGGDSKVEVKDGSLEIGPNRLGPAMAYGGPVPTPTDALIVLGEIQYGDLSKAYSGIESIATQLNTTAEKAAEQILNKASQLILDAILDIINRINRKPVYTVHELLEGYSIKPKTILILGGPAPYFVKYLENNSEYKVCAVPGWAVANATGAALARTTCEVTLFADTEQKVIASPEEEFSEKIQHRVSRQDVIKKAYDLLKHKAIQRGANIENLEMEIIEDLEFNMVRGFHTAGKNIRIKAQVKPGLIQGYTAGMSATQG